MDDFEHPFNARAMKFHERLHEFFRSCRQRRIGYIFNLMEQRLNRLQLVLHFIVWAWTPFPASSDGDKIQIRRASRYTGCFGRALLPSSGFPFG